MIEVYHDIRQFEGQTHTQEAFAASDIIGEARLLTRAEDLILETLLPDVVRDFCAKTWAVEQTFEVKNELADVSGGGSGGGDNGGNSGGGDCTTNCVFYTPTVNEPGNPIPGLPEKYIDEPEGKTYFSNDFTTDPQGDLSTENADIVDTVGYSVITGENFVNGQITEHGLQTTGKTGIILDSVTYDQPVIIEGAFRLPDETCTIEIHGKTDSDNGVKTDYAVIMTFVGKENEGESESVVGTFPFRAAIFNNRFSSVSWQGVLHDNDVQTYPLPNVQEYMFGDFDGDKICVIVSGDASLENLTIKSPPPLINNVLFNNNFKNNSNVDLSAAITEGICHPDLEVYADTAGVDPVVSKQGLFFPSLSYLYIDNVEFEKPVYISATFNFDHLDTTPYGQGRRVGVRVLPRSRRNSVSTQITTKKQYGAFYVDATRAEHSIAFGAEGEYDGHSAYQRSNPSYPFGALGDGTQVEITFEVIIKDGLVTARAFSGEHDLFSYAVILTANPETIAITLSQCACLTKLKIAGEACTKEPIDFPELSGLDVLLEQDFLSGLEGGYHTQDSEVFHPDLLCLSDYDLLDADQQSIWEFKGKVTENGLENSLLPGKLYNSRFHNSIKHIDISKPFLISGAFKILNLPPYASSMVLLEISTVAKIRFEVKGGKSLHVLGGPVLTVGHFSDLIGREIAFKFAFIGDSYYAHITDAQTNETLYLWRGQPPSARTNIAHSFYKSIAVTDFSVKGSVLELPELPPVDHESILYYNNFCQLHDQWAFSLIRSEIVRSTTKISNQNSVVIKDSGLTWSKDRKSYPSVVLSHDFNLDNTTIEADFLVGRECHVMLVPYEIYYNRYRKKCMFRISSFPGRYCTFSFGTQATPLNNIKPIEHGSLLHVICSTRRSAETEIEIAATVYLNGTEVFSGSHASTMSTSPPPETDQTIRITGSGDTFIQRIRITATPPQGQ